MIMQSAFFKLADIIPLEDAVKYLKEAVEHSYGLKGKDVVDMNNAAIVPIPKQLQNPAMILSTTFLCR